MWDPKKALQGEDAPLKKEDHAAIELKNAIVLLWIGFVLFSDF